MRSESNHLRGPGACLIIFSFSPPLSFTFSFFFPYFPLFFFLSFSLPAQFGCYDWFNLTMGYVTVMSKAAFCSIRNIGRIRKHLTRDATETIIHAFVTSKLDSNNSLLYGITSTQVARLQRLQNIAARIITYIH